jgi:hypothetical protein
VALLAVWTSAAYANATGAAPGRNRPPRLLGTGGLTAADLQDAYGVTAAAQTGGEGHRVHVLSVGYVPIEQLLDDLNQYRADAGMDPCINECFEYISTSRWCRPYAPSATSRSWPGRRCSIRPRW